MEKTQLISVVVPAHNAELYIEKCVRSICNQTYRNIEIIVIDDGSEDDTYNICEKIARDDLRIQLFHQDNIGLVKTRKKSIGFCKGNYVMFVDADDWIASNMIESMYEQLYRYQVDMVCCDLQLEGMQKGKMKNFFESGYYSEEDVRKIILPQLLCTNKYFTVGLLPTICGKIFRIELFKKYESAVPDDVTLGEDAACVYPMVISGISMYVINQCFYHYFRNDNSMTLGFSEKQILGSIKLINYLNNCLLIDNNCTRKQMDFYILSLTENNLLNVAKAGVFHGIRKRWKEIKYFINEINLKAVWGRCKDDKIPIKSKIILWMCANSLEKIVMIYQLISHLL